MKKIAIVISSFSGKLDEEVVKEGMFSIPLQLIIEKEQWLEGFYSKEKKYEIVNKFVNADNFSTSLPPLALILEQMKELSSKYDDVLYLPLDSKLSSTCNTLINYAREYKNVKVFNNHLSGSALFRVGIKCKKMYEQGKTIDEIIKYLEEFDKNSIGYIIPKELKTFIKSGRLKGIKKTLLSSINLSLMIEVGEELKTVGIARTKKSAAVKVIGKIRDFLKEKNMRLENVDFTMIWAYERSVADVIEECLDFEHIKIKYNEESSIATMMHTGYGATYIGINPKIED